MRKRAAAPKTSVITVQTGAPPRRRGATRLKAWGSKA